MNPMRQRDPRIRMAEALDEFVSFAVADGGLQLPPPVAYRRLGEHAYEVLEALPKGWSQRHQRRLARELARTARLGLRGRYHSALQLAVRISSHMRERRRLWHAAPARSETAPSLD